MGWVDDLRAACTVRSSEHLPPLSLDEYVPVIPDEELDIFNTLIAAGIQKTKEIPRLSLKRNNGTNIGSLLRKEAHALRIRKLRQETLTPADHHLLHDVLHSAFIPNCGYEVVEEPRIPENDVGLENGASSALMPAAQEETRQEETVIIIEEEDWGEINVGNGVAGSEMDVQPPKILSYAEFKSAKDQLPERFGQYFRPSIFLRLSHDGGDHILACRFQVYVERKGTLDVLS
ncbi:hypothetical protein BJ742DRAFT_25275 [Cladochytrium replicatum]|nr:hypothetical protein BJ742DRAFT_25275 [Cladochytrium replicatum]